MSSGNGVDLAAVYQAVLAISADLRTFKAHVVAKFAQAEATRRLLCTGS